MTYSKNEISELVERQGYRLIKYGREKINGKLRIIVDAIDLDGYKYNYILKRKHVSRLRKVGITNKYSLYNIRVWIKINKKPLILLENNEYVGDREKLLFKCKNKGCRENFKLSWTHLRARNYGCQYCSGKAINSKNRFSTLYTKIAGEWHPAKNGNLSPDDFSYGSGKRVWWLCAFSHEYSSTIHSRTNMNSGCPDCANLKSESSLANELKEYCKNNFGAKIEYKVFKNPKTNRWLKCDIYMENKNTKVYIEVHGQQHYEYNFLWYSSLEKHNEQKERDKLKKNFYMKNGTYIEIDLRKTKTMSGAMKYILKEL